LASKRPPVRSWLLAEWALVPLRLFLGVTFLYAGLQKLSDPGFFNGKASNSIQIQMAGSARFSPVHALLTPLLHYAATIGYTIAFGELAIGLGILVGLWTRIAAVGGALLSFMLFLTVSFHSSPYFTGADIVFFFAWMPFIVAGGGSRLSIDGWLAGRAAHANGVATEATQFVPIEFVLVQRMCGNFSANTCRARAGAACDAAFCPVLIGAPPNAVTGADAVNRRNMMIGGVAVTAAALGLGAKVVGAQLNHSSTGSSTGSQLSLGTTTTSPPTTTTTAPTTTTTHGAGTATTEVTTTTTEATTTTTAQNLGTLLGKASLISVGKPGTFTVPSSGDPAIVIEVAPKNYVSYDTVCPHLGCTVQFAPSANLMICPCHGSQFKVNDGAVISGPAPRGLTKLDVVEGNDGNLYLK
jgi:thiosulfate dehydrogenase [quinone] large subunit